MQHGGAAVQAERAAAPAAVAASGATVCYRLTHCRSSSSDALELPLPLLSDASHSPSPPEPSSPRAPLIRYSKCHAQFGAPASGSCGERRQKWGATWRRRCCPPQACAATSDQKATAAVKRPARSLGVAQPLLPLRCRRRRYSPARARLCRTSPVSHACLCLLWQLYMQQQAAVAVQGSCISLALLRLHVKAARLVERCCRRVAGLHVHCSRGRPVQGRRCERERCGNDLNQSSSSRCPPGASMPTAYRSSERGRSHSHTSTLPISTTTAQPPATKPGRTSRAPTPHPPTVQVLHSRLRCMPHGLLNEPARHATPPRALPHRYIAQVGAQAAAVALWRQPPHQLLSGQHRALVDVQATHHEVRAAAGLQGDGRPAAGGVLVRQR